MVNHPRDVRRRLHQIPWRRAVAIADTYLRGPFVSLFEWELEAVQQKIHDDFDQKMRRKRMTLHARWW